MKRSAKLALSTVLVAAGVLGAVACGGGKQFSASVGAPSKAPKRADGTIDDQSKCDWRNRSDREVSETAGPGAVTPNVRRVFQIVGTGEDAHNVLVCREMDTNFDGVKDVVRFFNEKGEPLREEADTNYDFRTDVWLTFAAGRLAKEAFDHDYDGQPDEWKFYVGGALSRVQRDTNRDGKPDRWEFYKDGVLERMGVDVDFDGHVDRWDHDELAKANAEAAARAAQSAAKTLTSDAGAGTESVAAAEPASGIAAPVDAADAGSDAGPASKRLKEKAEKSAKSAKDAGAK